MRKFILITLVFLCSVSHADFWGELAKGMMTNAFSASDAKDVNGILRFAAGYAQGEMYDVTPEEKEKFDEFDKGTGYWGEVDFGFLMMLHFGYSRMEDKTTMMSWNGEDAVKTAIQFDKYQYGLKLLLPIPILNPYIGGGILSGSMKATDQTADSDQSEHSRFIGRYWHAGLDVLLTSHMGLRLSYQNDTLRTRKFDALQNTKIEMEQHIGQAGLLLYF